MEPPPYASWDFDVTVTFVGYRIGEDGRMVASPDAELTAPSAEEAAAMATEVGDTLVEMRPQLAALWESLFEPQHHRVAVGGGQWLPHAMTARFHFVIDTLPHVGAAEFAQMDMRGAADAFIEALRDGARDAALGVHNPESAPIAPQHKKRFYIMLPLAVSNFVCNHA